MDRIIKRWSADRDDDLMIAVNRGVAYQRDMSKSIVYDNKYYQHYVGIEGTGIAKKINAARVGLVNAHAGALEKVLDVGIGSGEFIRSRPNTFGTDINPKAIKYLKIAGLYADNLNQFRAFTFWDVLEHIPEPDNMFRHMPDGCFLFTSLPTFTDLNRVRKSKHYKPNEHYYYWTEDGFVNWMTEYRFRLLEKNRAETDAGREGITSFAFVRDLPGYHQTIDQYRQLYEPNYGASAYLYFDQIAKEVLRINPKSILDYGCGKSDLVAHFWNDGKRRIAKYDPAIAQYKEMPAEDFDLVICCDVMEHILMADIDIVLKEICNKSSRAIFTISTKPARAKLPDGRNAHVSLLTPNEWEEWINSIFGTVNRIATHDDKILMIKTFG